MFYIVEIIKEEKEEEEKEGPNGIQNFIFLLHTGIFWRRLKYFLKNIWVNRTLGMPS